MSQQMLPPKNRWHSVFEDFIVFLEMGKVDAEAISTAIVTAIRDVGLSMDNLRGQGYDGASVMSDLMKFLV